MCKYESWVNMNYGWGGQTHTQTERHTERQTHQYHDSAWPRVKILHTGETESINVTTVSKFFSYYGHCNL